jgi:hypothetical protein
MPPQETFQMARRVRPGLQILRFVSVLLLAVPPLTVGGVWGWMALSGRSPLRQEIFAFGERAIVLLMLAGVVGLVAEFLILPILLNDGATGRADGGD